jgi:hypothetical protein
MSDEALEGLEIPIPQIDASEKRWPKTPEGIEAKRDRLHKLREEGIKKREQRELLKNIDLPPTEIAWQAFDQAGATYLETDQSFPNEFDYSVTNGMDEKDAFLLSYAFDGYVSFLKRPIITDKFQSHPERAKWRKKAEADMRFLDQSDGNNKTDRVETFTNIYKSNRLNLNSLFEIPGYTDLLLDDPNKLPQGFPIDSLKKIRKLSANFTTKATNNIDYVNNPNPWDTLPLHNTKETNGRTRLGKLAILHQLEKEIMTVVNFLGQH